MIKTPICVTAGAMALSMFAGNLSAQSALRDVAEIREGLIAVGIAYQISEECGDISARTLRGYGYLNTLRNIALDRGFSGAQIDAYVDDRAEQDRLKSIALQRLASKGAVTGQESTFCAVGRAEIASGSTIGYLLR